MDIVTPGHAGSDTDSRFARIEGLNLRSAIFLQRAIRQSAKRDKLVEEATAQEVDERFSRRHPTYSESVAYM